MVNHGNAVILPELTLLETRVFGRCGATRCPSGSEPNGEGAGWKPVAALRPLQVRVLSLPLMKENANLRTPGCVLKVEGDCPLCRAGLKPSVLATGRDLRTGKAFGINLPVSVWNRLVELQKEHEPFGTELCLLRREDEDDATPTFEIETQGLN